jgi:hypothetical protein
MIPLLLLMLLAPLSAAPKADAETIKTVELFLKTPTESLPPESIEGFMAVDVETLPKALREKTQAKKLELHVLRHIADGKKKGFFRTPGPECARPKEAGSLIVKILRMAGFSEITKREKEYLEQRTTCTERELMCEFTLQVVENKRPGRDPIYLLHEKDQLMAYLAEFRQGRKSTDTNFFGSLKPTCPK